MNSLSLREKILLIILAAFASFFLICKYGTGPQIKRYNDALKTYKNDMDNLLTLKSQQKNIAKLKNQVDELTKKNSESQNIIPDTVRYPEIIMDINSIILSSNCKIVKISFTEENNQTDRSNKIQNKTSKVLFAPVNFSVSGTYDDMIFLMGKIENNERKLSIDKVVMNKDRNTSSIIADFDISCPYLKQGNPSEPVKYPFMGINTGKKDLFN